MGDVLGGSALESPGMMMMSRSDPNQLFIRLACCGAPGNSRTFWHRYTLIVTLPLYGWWWWRWWWPGALCNIIRFILKICLFYYAFWMLRLLTIMWQWQNEFQLALLLNPVTRSKYWSIFIATSEWLINCLCCLLLHYFRHPPEQSWSIQVEDRATLMPDLVYKCCWC